MLEKLGVVDVEPGTAGQDYSYQCDPIPPIGSQGGGSGTGPANPPDSGGGGGGGGPCGCSYITVYDENTGHYVTLPVGCCP